MTEWATVVNLLDMGQCSRGHRIERVEQTIERTRSPYTGLFCRACYEELSVIEFRELIAAEWQAAYVRNESIVDEIAIELRCQGYVVRCTRREMDLAFDRLWRHGFSSTQICRILHLNGVRVHEMIENWVDQQQLV